jgi:hypothetical protein
MPIITTEQIPCNMWKRHAHMSARWGSHTLRLPSLLLKAYRELIDELDLREQAEDETPNDEGPQGGLTKTETNTHFARNFSGSCARIQLVMLDPFETFETTRDLFVRLFAGGSLHLLDIPCGAGAAGATLLCLAAELRKQNVLPRNPLRVSILGGDISAPAREIKRRLFRKLRPRLAEYGIVAKVSIQDWNVRDAMMTTTLIDRWLASQAKHSSSAIFALNFSGFLSNKVKECSAQLREIVRYGRVRESSIVWIEPRTNVAIDQLFPSLTTHVLTPIPKMRAIWVDFPRQSQCSVAHPIKTNSRFIARAAAMHIEPVRENV